MLGIIADLIAGVVTILFPVFASYKALKVSDPAQLAPWCIYWVVLSLFLLLESWTVFIVGWLPFYSWIRLFLLSYLVLPQTQGAKLLYFNYISPFIESHEHDIEVFIADAHERAASAGLNYLKKLVDLIREKVLGLPPPQAAQPPPPQPQTYGDAAAAYATNLLSRFNIPQARVPAVPTAPSDLYSLLSSAISSASTATSKPSATTQSEDLTSPTEKLSFLTAQRERLVQLLGALDREQSTLTTEKSSEADIDSRMQALDPTAAVESNLSRNRNKSEHSFENIERDEYSEGEAGAKRTSAASPRSKRTVSSGWVPTWLGGGTPTAAGETDPTQATDDKAPEEASEESTGKTSGFELGS